MNYRRDEQLIFDIIFITVVFTLIGNIFYHAIYPTGYQECEMLSAGDSFTYNAFDGCIINGVKQ